MNALKSRKMVIGFLAVLFVILGAAVPTLVAGNSSSPKDRRANAAVEWARNQWQAGKTHTSDGRNWSGWCAKFVANAYGTSAAGHRTAYLLYQERKRSKCISSGQPKTPGSLVFWTWTGTIEGVTDNYGHVGIYVGGGRVIHAFSPKTKPICKDKIWDIARKIGGNAKYLGYGPTPEKWPGLSPQPLPTPTPVQIVTLRLYVHAGSASGKRLSGVLVTGKDGAGKGFVGTTNYRGYVRITGTPGTWKFAASRSGYCAARWSQTINSSCIKRAFLKIGNPQPPSTSNNPVSKVTLRLYVHAGSASGKRLSGVLVTGKDGAGKRFVGTTNYRGYVRITGTPGTWKFAASKSGYLTVRWSQTINSSCIKRAFLKIENPKPPPTSNNPVRKVTLMLYVHAGSTSGKRLSGVLVTGKDGAGKGFVGTTNYRGYIRIAGTPGTWKFAASRSGYLAVRWGQQINAACTKHAFLKIGNPQPPSTSRKPVSKVTLRLYVHVGNANGKRLSGVLVIGQDGAGKRFAGTTNYRGYVRITGTPGIWKFAASRSGYRPAAWNQQINGSCTKRAFLKIGNPQPPSTSRKPVSKVTLRLYVHVGNANGKRLSGVLVTGQDGAGKRFAGTTNYRGYVRITGTPGIWKFAASRSGYRAVTWSQSINATCTRHAFLKPRT